MARATGLIAGLCLLSIFALPLAGQERREIKVMSGKIKLFQRSDPATVMIVTDSGEVAAELAPATYLETHKLVFNPNEAFPVRGVEVVKEGHKNFVVTEVPTTGHPAVRLRSDDLKPVWTIGTQGGTREIKVFNGKIT